MAPPPLWVIWAAFVIVGLILYAPVLQGAFISDDSHYVLKNQYVHDLTLDNVIAIWDPTSEVAVLVENYAPVHLMLHAVEWQFFGAEVTGYHVVNLLLHAWAAVLLLSLYRRSGLGAWVALAGSAWFFLHPGNVESVAWISQLKSSAALVLSLLAILLHPSRPALALLSFALALFAKPFSAFALPVVLLFGWLRSRTAQRTGETAEAFAWGWLATWLVVVGLFAWVESAAFGQSAGLAPPLYAELSARYMTIFSVFIRYAWMAISGTGLSTFHEPPPVLSPADPLFLAGVILMVLLGWRTLWTLRKGSEEAVWWLWAAIAFAPLSGVLPLPYPMADRYLYFILPGLIGGVCLAWRDAVAPWLVDKLDREARDSLRKVLAGGFLIWLAWFSWQTYRQAPVYRSAEALMAEAERNYPDGAAAQIRRAGREAALGNVVLAVEHLRAARARGYNRVDHLLGDRRYDSLRSDPGFIALRDEMAEDWIARLEVEEAPSHYKARALAQAYVAKGDLRGALVVIEGAADRPGPIREGLLRDAEDLQRQIDLEDRLSAERRRLRARRKP